MYRFRFLLNVLLLRSCHFLQPFFGVEEWRYIAKFFSGNQLQGEVANLEQEVCRLTKSKYALGLNLGRSAIQVALEAFNFPPQSEVILPSFSCTGVIVPVIQAGLQPVLADVDRDFNLRFESVAAGLSARTRAVILPHLSGKFARDSQKILDLAQQKGLKVIEDACQSFGLKRGDKWAGTFGDVGVFSFGLGKNLFGPGGGLLLTDDAEVIQYCRSRSLAQEGLGSVRRRLGHFLWRFGCPRGEFLLSSAQRVINYGLARRGEPPILQDFLFPVQQISGIEAAISLCQVKKFREVILKRQANAQSLLTSTALRGAGLDLPDPEDHIFTKFLVSSATSQEAAVALRQLLHSHGIETELSYTPLHLRTPFAGYKHTDLTETERRWRGAFAIPVTPRLSPRDKARIIRVARIFSATGPAGSGV